MFFSELMFIFATNSERNPDSNALAYYFQITTPKKNKMIMKKLLLSLLAFTMTSINVMADDDIMITRDGSMMEVKIEKISTSQVTYIDLKNKKRGSQNKPTDFVYMIVKEKGNNIFFDEDGNQMTSPVVKYEKKDNVLFLNRGEMLVIYNVSVSKNEVSYQLKDKKKEPYVKIPKSEVFMIRNSDGTTTLFNDSYQEKKNRPQQVSRPQNITPKASPIAQTGQQATETSPTISPQETTLSKESSDEDFIANQQALAKWNTFPMDAGKEKKKRAPFLCCVLRPDQDSHIADRNVELAFHGANELLSWRNEVNFVLSVKNKTNKTIYLDLGNTFFIRGEQAVAYYIPTANSSTSGTNTSVGVNLGAVAGAMGVGGTVGKLANGVNVGKGSSNYNTTVTYSQRVIAVPPMSKKDLDAMEIRRMNPKMPSPTGDYLPKELDLGTTLNIGGSMVCQEGQFPVTFGSFLTYSFTEDIQEPKLLQAKYSIRKIIGVPEGKDLAMGTGLVNGKDLTPEQLNDFFCIIKQAK